MVPKYNDLIMYYRELNTMTSYLVEHDIVFGMDTKKNDHLFNMETGIL